MLLRIVVFPTARADARAAVHAAAELAAHRGRAAGVAFARAGAAARARRHRARVAGATGTQAAPPFETLARSPGIGMSASLTVRCACCVTFPTIALSAVLTEQVLAP